jgi:hypothetical protein
MRMPWGARRSMLARWPATPPGAGGSHPNPRAQQSRVRVPPLAVRGGSLLPSCKAWPHVEPAKLGVVELMEHAILHGAGVTPVGWEEWEDARMGAALGMRMRGGGLGRPCSWGLNGEAPHARRQGGWGRTASEHAAGGPRLGPVSREIPGDGRARRRLAGATLRRRLPAHAWRRLNPAPSHL